MGVDVSVVVVVWDMARELPRTLATLAADAQHGDVDYEVIVVDNGSPVPVDPRLLDLVPGGRLIRLDPAPSSPARAANVGIEAAAGSTIGVMIDGARMVSPGLLAGAADAMRLGPDVIAVTLAFHLGAESQMIAAAKGYDQAVEDALLETVDWRRDGYELFSISTLAGSSARGWFGPMGESNALFMRADRWADLGGFDEIFDRAGGGLVNHDLFRRACERPGAELVVLLGEGTFHQFHGGAATGGQARREELWAEYARLRGREFAPPALAPRYLGSVPAAAIPHFRRSLDWLEGNPNTHVPWGPSNS
ncbi:MAG: glycosyltransferase family A protein [Acidimicrobiales bacterium]